MSEEDTAIRNDVNYLRYLVTAGLTEELIEEIAEKQTPELEIGFSQEECQTKAETLEHGKYVVMIS